MIRLTIRLTPLKQRRRGEGQAESSRPGINMVNRPPSRAAVYPSLQQGPAQNVKDFGERAMRPAALFRRWPLPRRREEESGLGMGVAAPS